MIASMYLIGKVLTARMLMSPTKLGFGTKMKDQVLLNFRVLSSVLYH